MAKIDLGHLIEGVVEQDPMSDRYVIRTEDSAGKLVIFDVQEALAKLVGKEVRFTLASFDALDQLARMAEEIDGSPSQAQVFGIPAQDILRKLD